MPRPVHELDGGHATGRSGWARFTDMSPTLNSAAMAWLPAFAILSTWAAVSAGTAVERSARTSTAGGDFAHLTVRTATGWKNTASAVYGCAATAKTFGVANPRLTATEAAPGVSSRWRTVSQTAVRRGRTLTKAD